MSLHGVARAGLAPAADRRGGCGPEAESDDREAAGRGTVLGEPGRGRQDRLHTEAGSLSAGLAGVHGDLLARNLISCSIQFVNF
jgi:hypothetical protein